MNRKLSPHKLLHRRVAILYEDFIKDYKSKIEKARKDYQLKVHYAFLTKLHSDYFIAQRNLGENARFFLQIQDELENDKDKMFESLFDEKFEASEMSDKELLLNNLSILQALDEVLKFVNNEGIKYPNPYTDQTMVIRSDIKWKGTKELEFIQLIYALHESGYLTNQQGEITTLVKQVALAFNFSLGGHWQSNLSKSVNIRKAGYKPEIFKKLEQAFDTYREKQINKGQ